MITEKTGSVNFNTFEFALFFIVVYALYLPFGHKWQNRMLLAASWFFYGCWDWRFLGLIFISTLTDYICALRIYAHPDAPDIRKRFLATSLGINLSILFFFKYFNFFLENFIGLFSFFGISLNLRLWNIVLPVGISFYTFQTLSYTVDVYRKQMMPTRNFLDYALYVSFFPQLVAGPIERAGNLLPQIARPRVLRAEFLSEGAFLVYWGLFKKIFIADNLGSLIRNVGSPVAPDGMSGDGGMILAVTYAFLFQLYCDFSAYSDIARGTARLLGFDIMTNFRAPLFAPNIQETWNRWHISLTSWIRDYLYFPLALTKIGGRHLNVRLVVILTFFIMGLWHGASWNYILWGVYNGLLLAAYASVAPKMRRLGLWRRERPFMDRMLYGISVLVTFHAAVIGVLFFRVRELPQIANWLYYLFAGFRINGETVYFFMQFMFYVLPLLAFDIIIYKNEDIKRIFRYPAVVRYSFFYITFYLMVVHRAMIKTFIYFQF